MSAISKLLACFVAASALTLYGCGGDSKVKPKAPAAAPMAKAPAVSMEEEEPMEPAGPTETADALAVAKALIAKVLPDSVLPDRKVSYDEGVKVTVTDPGRTAAVFDDTVFEEIDPPHSVRKWHGSRHQLMDDDMTETMTVYTNKEAPGDEIYTEYYAMDRTGVSKTDVVEMALVLTLDVSEAGVAAAAKAGLYASDFLPDSESEHLTYGTDDDDHSLPFKGTFNGVPGKYACTGDCEAEADKDGNLESLMGTWTFTPAERDVDKDGPHVVMGVTDMTDYLQFGYWLESTAEEDGTTSYRVKSFSGGGMAFQQDDFKAGENNTAIQAVLGTATYAGPAGGLYVHKTGTLDEVESAMSGSFTANANLKAYFGPHDDVPPGSQFSIHGTVDGFRDGSRSLEGWSVKLNSASFLDGKIHSNKFSNTTTGSATSSAGTWSGQFFGKSTKATGDVPASMPSGVAGEFNGHFANGHVNGAFGAVRQD